MHLGREQDVVLVLPILRLHERPLFPGQVKEIHEAHRPVLKATFDDWLKSDQGNLMVTLILHDPTKKRRQFLCRSLEHLDEHVAGQHQQASDFLLRIGRDSHIAGLTKM